MFALIFMDYNNETKDKSYRDGVGLLSTSQSRLEIWYQEHNSGGMINGMIESESASEAFRGKKSSFPGFFCLS